MLTEQLRYQPFSHCDGTCDWAFCQLPPWQTPIQSARGFRAQKPRNESAVLRWDYEPTPRRYLGSLAKQFSPSELDATQQRVCHQIEQLGQSARTPGTRASGLVGVSGDFELTLALGRVLSDGLPTLDVLHLSWVPYAEAGHYWKQHGRDSSLPILLALEQYACSIKRRLRLVDVRVPRLREYFCQLRGYTPQSNNANCLLDTAGLDVQYYEK